MSDWEAKTRALMTLPLLVQFACGGPPSSAKGDSEVLRGKCPEGTMGVPARRIEVDNSQGAYPRIYPEWLDGQAVDVAEFCIDVGEFTLKDYEVCRAAGDCKEIPGHVVATEASPEQALTFVTHETASELCSRVGKRLISWLEWEAASRAWEAGKLDIRQLSDGVKEWVDCNECKAQGWHMARGTGDADGLKDPIIWRGYMVDEGEKSAFTGFRCSSSTE